MSSLMFSLACLMALKNVSQNVAGQRLVSMPSLVHPSSQDQEGPIRVTMGQLMPVFPQTAAKVLQINPVEVCVPTMGAWGMVCVASAKNHVVGKQNLPVFLGTRVLGRACRVRGFFLLVASKPIRGRRITSASTTTAAAAITT